jgi:outer membrane protein assembly factor BamE (lipoprotein component of BamABCDE complex)
MKPLHARRRHLLAALASAGLLGLAAGPAAARPGYMDPSTRAKVSAGMTEAEVTELLGKPQKTRKYREGSTWGYMIRQPETWFLVDFGTDGKVKAAKEQVIPAF